MTTLIEAALIASTLSFKKSWEENGDTRYILSELDLEITETSGGEVLLEGQNIQAFVADLLKTLNRPAPGQTDQLLADPDTILLQDSRATLYKRTSTGQFHICREVRVGERPANFSAAPSLPDLPIAMALYVETLNATLKATAGGMVEALRERLAKRSGGERIHEEMERQGASPSAMDALRAIFGKD